MAPIDENTPFAREHIRYAIVLSNKLQKLRKRLDLSQEDVAQRAGLSTYTYQKYEMGDSRPGDPMNPKLTTLIGLASALETTVTYLVSLDD